MFALHSMQAFGQINTATLSGAVKDPSGAVVSNAAVIVLQTATGIARTAQTNEAGLFTVPLLQPGVYTVTVSKSGFESATESNIELQVNQLASLNITLTVGSVKQTVTVAASAPVLETETAGLGTVITTKEIDELPLNGRQFIQLLQLAPGSVPVSVSQTAVPNLGNSGSNVTPAVNGQTGRSNLFYVDGLYATDPFFGSRNRRIPIRRNSAGPPVPQSTWQPRAEPTSSTAAHMSSSGMKTSKRRPILQLLRESSSRISTAALLAAPSSAISCSSSAFMTDSAIPRQQTTTRSCPRVQNWVEISAPCSPQRLSMIRRPTIQPRKHLSLSPMVARKT